MALLLIPVLGAAIFIASIIWAFRRPKKVDSEFPDYISVVVHGVLVGVLLLETVVIRLLLESTFPTEGHVSMARLFLSSLLITILLAGLTLVGVITVALARKLLLRRTLLTLVWAASASLLWLHAVAWTDVAAWVIA